MDTKGYAMIRTGAPGTSVIDLKEFYDHPVRVMEFARDGSVLVVNAEATGLASFEPEDVLQKFECTEVGHVICPPGLDPVGQMMYSGRCLTRKGGYNQLLRNMVVVASLKKGTFTDGFLWAVENEERARAAAAQR